VVESSLAGSRWWSCTVAFAVVESLGVFDVEGQDLNRLYYTYPIDPFCHLRSSHELGGLLQGRIQESIKRPDNALVLAVRLGVCESVPFEIIRDLDILLPIQSELIDGSCIYISTPRLMTVYHHN
jgi:hypothetical protein